MAKRAKKSKSPAVEQMEAGATTGYQFTPEEALQYAAITKRIISARNQRETPRDEFDGMSYEQTYLANKRAAMSYLQPKKNESEVRVNTATTEKRLELVVNEILALNLQGQLQVYDKDDNMMQDAGEVFSDLVTRSLQMEEADTKNRYIYHELFSQPSVYVEEVWSKMPGKSERYRAERRLLQGIQVYKGDINLPDYLWHEQPFLVKYARLGFSQAERQFKDLNPAKWDLVKPGAYQRIGALGAAANTNLYRKGTLENDEVEAFWYFSYPDDEVQVFVNGIPMLDVGHSYTEEFGDLGTYHIATVSNKVLGGDFSDGKSLVQSAKTLQALDNEIIRNMIRKFRQSIEPPIGTTKRRLFSRDVWEPGKVTHGISTKDFEKLIDHQGVTQSEFAMFDLVEKKVNEFMGTSQQEPLQGKSKVTATELNQAQQRAIKMLGGAVLAAMILESRLSMLRIKQLLLRHSKPVGRKLNPFQRRIQDVYARFTIGDADIGDSKGTRIVQLTDRALTREEQLAVFDFEEKERKAGRPTQFRTLNMKALADLDLYFFATAVAKPRESTELEKANLTEMLNQGVAISQITGRPLKANKIIDRFERAWRIRGVFEEDAVQMEQNIANAGAKRTPEGERMRSMATAEAAPTQPMMQ